MERSKVHKRKWRRRDTSGQRGKRFTNLWQQQGVSDDLYRNINFLPRASPYNDADYTASSTDAITKLSMPDGSTNDGAIFASRCETRKKKEGKRKHGPKEKHDGEEQQRRGVTIASGRQVVPLLLSSHSVWCSFSVFPPFEARAPATTTYIALFQLLSLPLL